MTGPADTLLLNGRIHTMDPAMPMVSALAIRDGRVVATGSVAAMDGLNGPNTRVVDLPGKMVMPGIVDFHMHLLNSMERRLFSIALDPSDDWGAVLNKLSEGVARQTVREWVTAGPFGPGALEAMRQPGALAALDAVTGNRPAMLRHVSGHGSFANSAALDRAGIGPDTPDPADGEIVKDARGRPTGLLNEAADWPVRDAIPALTPAELVDVARQATAFLNGKGITGFCDASATREMLEAFKALDDEGGLSCWAGFNLALSPTCSGYDPASAQWLQANRHALCGPHMVADFAKIFLDGVPSLRTAAMLSPYASAPDEPPVPMALDLRQLTDAIGAFDAAGLGVKVHAIGDRAVLAVLDAVEAVRSRNGPGGPQHHIAHGQFIRKEDIPRLRALNVLADINPPLWFPNSASLTHERVVGPERYTRSWAIRDILRSGADMAVGSDWMTITAELEPWHSLCGIMTRRDPAGRFPGAHRPDQALTLEEALPLYTAAPARAMGLEQRTGRLVAGLSADLVVLDRDLTAIDPMAIAGTEVLATMFEGRVVHGGLEESTVTGRSRR